MNDKYRVLILVTDKSQVRGACQLYKKLCAIDRRPLILGDNGVEIKDKNFLSKSIYYYQDISKINYDKIKNDTYDLFHYLADKEVSGGGTLRQLTSYKGVSFWDLSVHYIFSELFSVLYHINLAQAILDFEQPREVYALSDKDMLSKVICLFCSEKSISFKVNSRVGFGRGVWINRFLLESLFLFKKLKKLFVACYCSVLNLTKSFYLKKTYKVIFFAPIERFFLEMIPVVLKYTNDERLVFDLFPRECARKLKENKIFYLDFSGFSPFHYFNSQVNTILRRVRDAICRGGVFTRGIIYKGLPIGILLSEIFRKAIQEKFPHEIRRIDIIRRIVFSYKPKVIVLSDSSSELVPVFKSLAVPVVSMQTGHTDEFTYYSPCVSDVVTVGGNHWKEQLSKKGFSADRIYIAGPAKFDFLHSDNLNQGSNNLLKDKRKYKKIIMFATIHSQPGLGVIDYERLNQTRRVFNVIKNINEAHLIVKMHPFDTSSRIYEKIARDTGLLDFSIIGNSNILKLLNSCDLVITHYSGVSYDAVLMDKNVLLLYPSSSFINNDPWNFKQYGVATAVENLDELENNIRAILFNPEISSRLKEKRGQYIFEHAYKMDGKASERIRKVIDQFA